MTDKKLDLKQQPIDEFITFSETQSLLKTKGRGPIEYKLKKGHIRYHMISPQFGKIRMIYRPDVLRMIEKQKKAE